jgi:GNAT superfamily N-acetyltransferase
VSRKGASAANVIEPFDPERHDRTAFSCGVEQVDNFFRKTANKLSRAGNLRTFVMVGAEGELIGFYALNAHSVDYDRLPPRYARDRPGHGRIPAAYIAMIGVDRRFHGKGHGDDLLVDALIRIARAAEEIGLAIVMLDILDCGDPERVEQRRRLYMRRGFTPLPSNPLRLFLPVATVRKLLDKG